MDPKVPVNIHADAIANYGAHNCPFPVCRCAERCTQGPRLPCYTVPIPPAYGANWLGNPIIALGRNSLAIHSIYFPVLHQPGLARYGPQSYAGRRAAAQGWWCCNRTRRLIAKSVHDGRGWAMSRRSRQACLVCLSCTGPCRLQE